MFIDGPSPGPVAQPMPLLLILRAGTLTQYLPAELMNRYGFSRMTGRAATTVNGEVGHRPGGLLVQPTNVMFQVPPIQLCMLVFLVNHCCCEPDAMLPSILLSAMKPPLAKPPIDRAIAPFT